MVSFALQRLALFAERREWLPPLLLLGFAMATLIAFGGARETFYGDGHHKWNSVLYMTLADNLSVEERLRLILYTRMDADGETVNTIYGRFPVGGVILIKLATMPFDGLASKIFAARALMLSFFAASVLLAYLAISRIAASRAIGLAAALIAFSSFYPLYHSDDIAPEVGMDLFGCAMVFHGMFLFVRDKRFGQLAVKACAALLLGWHVYAILFLFIAFKMAGALAAWVRAGRGARRATFRSTVSTFGKYAALGAVSLIFGIAVLGFNIVNERAAYGDETSFAELETVQSILKRTSLETPDSYDPNAYLLEWREFLKRQFYRVGGATIPYALAFGQPQFPEAWDISSFQAAVGVLAVGAALTLAALARRDKALWATLILFGLFYAIVMRRHTFWPPHSFESVFFAGVPLALSALALARARDAWGARPIRAAAVAALAAFAVSAIQIGGLHDNPADEQIRKTLMADFATIRENAAGKATYIEDSWLESLGQEFHQEMNYYAAGIPVVMGGRLPFAQMSHIDFVIGEYRGDRRLVSASPSGDRLAFLYDVELPDLYESEWRRARSYKRAVDSIFEARLGDGALYYLKEPCAEGDVQGRFLLTVHPSDVNDLPGDSRELGHESESRNFSFSPPINGALFNGKCIIRRELPGYAIDRLDLGQWGEGVEEWNARLVRAPDGTLVDERLEMYRRAADGEMGEPLVQADFDVYLDDNALFYIKEPCAQDDARGRFLVSVYPKDAERVSASQKAKGFSHDSLNFAFADNGFALGGGRCMARVALPDYPISAIDLGRWGDGVEEWSARLVARADGTLVDERLEMYRRATDGDMGAPLVRADFDVYLDANALVYAKEPCAQDDTLGRFLLSVYPQDADDVSESQKAKGLAHDSLNFNFADIEIAVGGGRCMARVELPDYEIDRLELAQWIPGGETRWAETAAMPAR